MPDDVTIRIGWLSLGRRATQPPDPASPNGVVVDLTLGQRPSCSVSLPYYPAPAIGTWLLACKGCGFTAAVTAAGRPDDPRRVLLPCRPIGHPVGNA
jgi:hypothetical protein